jgi:RHS repeat-associated protein
LILAPYPLFAETQFFHSDPLGSPTQVTATDGHVVQSVAYSPFGESLIPPNPPLKKGGLGGFSAYQFTGQELDAESLLYNYGARFYDPALSRFVSTDPVLGNPPYAYVHNNPIQRIDPDGKADKDFQELLRRFESSSIRLAEKSLRLASKATRLAVDRYGAKWDSSLSEEQQKKILDDIDDIMYRDPETDHDRTEIAVESMMAKSLAKELKAEIEKKPELLQRLNDRQLIAYTELTKGLPNRTTLHFSGVDGEEASKPFVFPVNLDRSLGQNGSYGTPRDSILAKMGILPSHGIGIMPPPNPWVSPDLGELRESLGTNRGYGGDLDGGSLTGPMLFATGVVAIGLGCTLFPSVCFSGGAAVLAVP